MHERRQAEAEHAAIVATTQASMDSAAQASREAKRIVAASEKAIVDSCELLFRVGDQFAQR
jgi:hypothetical protein